MKMKVILFTLLLATFATSNLSAQTACSTAQEATAEELPKYKQGMWSFDQLTETGRRMMASVRFADGVRAKVYTIEGYEMYFIKDSHGNSFFYQSIHDATRAAYLKEKCKCISTKHRVRRIEHGDNIRTGR